MEKEVCFRVRFKPRLSWADKVFLGNMLMEVLGVVSKSTSAFEFEVESVD
ncbi:MAG: hypothetical protein ACUVWK_02450 [Nitrososphaerales archaeon]